MNLFIKLIIKPLRSLLKLLFNRIFYVALALVVQLAWLLIALFRLMEYSRWVTIGMQAIGFLVVLWIVNKKINPSYKLAWTMLILVFQVFGVSLYLLFGKSRIGTVMEQHYQNLIDETAEYLEGSELTRKRLNEDDRSMRIQSDYIWQYSRYPVHENTTAEYFQVGDDMFPVLVRELKQAKKYIFIEYFIINDGVMWQTILNILEKKAAEGVDVRLIYDGFGCLTTLPHKYYEELQKKGIKCQVTSIATKAFKGDPKIKAVVIPATVRKIGKEAFAKCKNLKKITIKTTYLSSKKVGANAFKGIHAKAIIKVPKKQKKAYQKLLKARGIGKKVTVK